MRYPNSFLYIFSISFLSVTTSLHLFLSNDPLIKTEDISVPDSSIALSVFPTILSDGDTLFVSWDAHFKYHFLDKITLSCGPQKSLDDYLFEIYIIHTTTKRNAVFPDLIMLRCDYIVRYHHFSYTKLTYIVVASVKIPMSDAFSAPKQGHISFTSKVDEMVIMYNSGSAAESTVHFGENASQLMYQKNGTSTTYRSQDMCGKPASIDSQRFFRNPGYFHKIILEKLKPDTQYFYRLGDDRTGFGKVYSFRSRPIERRETTFVAYGDMGPYYSGRLTLSRLREDSNLDFVLHFGDVGYAMGEGYAWDLFMYYIETVATRLPYLVSVGNHEYDYLKGGKGKDPSGAVDELSGGMAFQPEFGGYIAESGGECSVPLFHRFHTPNNGRGLYWYSFDYSVVHVIQMSSEHDWRKGSDQYVWIENDLKNVDRKRTPWIVLTAHRMMYTTQLGTSADNKVASYFRAEIEPLLLQYRVNVVLTGHQHSYERTCPVMHGKCVEKGPVHYVVGTGGTGLESSGFSSWAGNFSVSHTEDWGYLRLNANEDQLRLQFILSKDGSIFDEITLQPWL